MRIYIAFEETNRREGRDIKDVEAKKIQFDFLTSYKVSSPWQVAAVEYMPILKNLSEDYKLNPFPFAVGHVESQKNIFNYQNRQMDPDLVG